MIPLPTYRQSYPSMFCSFKNMSKMFDSPFTTFIVRTFDMYVYIKIYCFFSLSIHSLWRFVSRWSFLLNFAISLKRLGTVVDFIPHFTLDHPVLSSLHYILCWEKQYSVTRSLECIMFLPCFYIEFPSCFLSLHSWLPSYW